MKPWAVPSTALIATRSAAPCCRAGRPRRQVCSWLNGTPIRTSTMIEMPTTVASTRYQARTVFTRPTVLR